MNNLLKIYQNGILLFLNKFIFILFYIVKFVHFIRLLYFVFLIVQYVFKSFSLNEKICFLFQLSIFKISAYKANIKRNHSCYKSINFFLN